MKILVAVKRTIDYNVKVRVNADQTAVDITHAKMAMNPFCEIAVEEAVRLKEKGIATEIVAVSIGEEKAQEQLRAAMAVGADRSILIKGPADLEPLAVAKLLHKVVEKEAPDLIILGKQSIDTDNNQVGQMLAALCGVGQGTFAFKLEVEDGRAVVSREIDGGEETVSLQLPAVITTDLRLNEPRYVKLPDIMKAKKKPVETLAAEDFGLDLTPRLQQIKVTEPPARQAGVMVDSVAALVDKLKNEAKVLS